MLKQVHITPDNHSIDDEEGCVSVVGEIPTVRSQSYREIGMLAYSSLGAIYGDIGTSPLYVLNSIKYHHSPPNREDIYGAVSLIFYLFLFVVLIKYSLIVLTFGPNEGEGGQVAIYAKIARCLRFGPKGVIIPGSPEKSDLELLKRTDTTSSFMSSKTTNSVWKQNPSVLKFISILTLFCCFLGCSLVISDGLLTPTTSVLSAVAGIQVANPSFTNVLAVSEVVLIVLFVIQQLGSHKISHVFAPIVLLWLIGLVICGVINISHHPAILKSLSPFYAIQLLRNAGIDALGGAMLAITGTEAMFADLGHFGKVPCQIGITFVFICLMITYLGQGAYLVNHADEIANVFYVSIPGGVNGKFYWVMFVLATLSTIIASQALILGVFSILSQMINLDCFPKLRVIHVSSSYAGKVYIPAANLLLLIGVVGATAGFKNSNNVTSAYGLGISLDFLVTSTLMVICMIYVYEFKWWIPLVFCLIFVPLELCLVIANLKKVPHGGWFPLMMCSIFFGFFSFWRYCRDRTVNEQLNSRVRIADLFPRYKRKLAPEVVDLKHRGTGVFEVGADNQLGTETENATEIDTGNEIGNEVGTETGNDMSTEDDAIDLGSEVNGMNIGSTQIDESSLDKEEMDIFQTLRWKEDTNTDAFTNVASRYGEARLATHPGIAIIYSDTPHQDLASPSTVPSVYAKIISNFASVPSVVIFTTIRVLSIPAVEASEKILVGATKIPGHYKCVLRFGFMEEVVIDDQLTNQIVEQFVDARINKETSILHIFETNKIRSHHYLGEEFATKNPFKLLLRYARTFMIDQVFSPLNSIFRFNDLYVRIVDEEEESKEKLFIGNVMRI